MPWFRSAFRRVRRILLARRRSLAALCAAAAVAAFLQAGSPPPPPRTMVLTAAHDIPGGAVLRAEDLERTPYLPGSVPAGVLPGPAAALGRTTTGPLRAGEALTDARLLTPSLLYGYPGLVAVPIRLGDPGAARLLRTGDRVDLLAADPRGGAPALVVGRDVAVLAIPRAQDESPGAAAGDLVVVGVQAETARTVAQASVTAVLSVVLTG